MATHSIVLAWRIPGTEESGAAIYGVAQSRTWLKRLGSSSSIPEFPQGHSVISSSGLKVKKDLLFCISLRLFSLKLEFLKIKSFTWNLYFSALFTSLLSLLSIWYYFCPKIYFKKSKIMASGPIASWQIEGKR